MATINVTDDSFKTDVLESDKPVLVDFWAEWCGPCKQIGPALEELSEEMNGQVKIVKVNVDENDAISAEYGIRAIPTMLVFKGGAVAEQIVGMLPKDALKAKLEAHL